MSLSELSGYEKRLQYWSLAIGFSLGITFQVETLIKANGNEFMWNKHLGYISTCPTNLGTGIRCSVHVKLPRLSRDDNFESIM